LDAVIRRATTLPAPRPPPQSPPPGSPSTPPGAIQWRCDHSPARPEQWPGYLAYLAAFLNISAIWINHHDLFTRIRRVDARLICANLLLLLVTSLFPWPASVISAAVETGDHSDQVAATVLYAAIGFLVPLAWIVLYRYTARSPHLLGDPHTRSFHHHRRGVSFCRSLGMPSAEGHAAPAVIDDTM
jgi:uncharacterized membrane protein